MIYAAAYDAAARPRAAHGFQTAAPTGRLMEHWNWAKDARQTIPVEVYTDCSRAELFLNGKSLGEKAVAERSNPVFRWDVPNRPAPCAPWDTAKAGKPRASS